MAVALTLGAVAASHADPSTPHVMFTTEVYSYPKVDPYDLANDYGFNHAPSVTRLADGRLAVAWFSGSYEASVHQVILASFSEDGGRTWSEAVVVQDEPTRSDFDPAWITKGDRTWLFYTVGRWNRYPFVGLRDAERREVGVDSYRLLTRVTDDGGQSWSSPERVTDETGWGCRSNGIVLSSGDLALPIYHFKAPYTAAVAISSDDGASWRRFGEIRTPEDTGAAEPTIAQLPDGTVLMTLRTYDGRLWLSRSSDQGRTWSAPTRMDMPANGSSHFLLTTTDGTLVLIHNPSETSVRTPLTLRTSRDRGKTWGEPLIIDQIEPTDETPDLWSRQVCYPSAVELPDGSLVVVWARLEIGNRVQAGDIIGARVRLNGGGP